MSGKPNQRQAPNQDSVESLSGLLQSKHVDWKAVKDVFVFATAARSDDSSKKSSEEATPPPSATIKIPDGLYRDALSRACLDPTVEPETLKLVLPERISKGLSTLFRIKSVFRAARCDNVTACRALVVQPSANDYNALNNQLLSWTDQRGNSLLHLVCAQNGWNSAIAYLLDATLEQQRLPRPDGISNSSSNTSLGLFHTNDKGHCPLWLSLEGGADIAEILNHMRQQHHLGYLKQNLELLLKIMAEYCTDMTALEELLDEDPSFLDAAMNSSDSTPLYHACYYQNPSMIRCLLRHQLRQRGEKRKKLLKKLMQKSKNNYTRKAPLAMLVLGVGRSDPGNSIECVQGCQDILGTFAVLHYTIEEALWPDTTIATTTTTTTAHSLCGVEPTLTATKQCLQTVQRMIDHWQIDLLSLDDKKRSIVSLLIMKHPLVAANNRAAEELVSAILEEILTRCPDAAFARDKRKRLPLHLACEAGWQWNSNERKEGEPCSNALLAQLVRANPSALEVIDPKSKVYPFALAKDLTTIYNLLRYQPAVVRSIKL